MGGPRPLPSQPVRPSQPPRPQVPGYRPPAPRPAGPRPSGPRRDQPRIQAPAATFAAPPPITRMITLAEGMTVSDLAAKLEVKANDVLKKLFEKGRMMRINSTLDNDTASMVAREFGADIKMQSFEE
jgi:translation initiation factor IF-2